MGVLLQIKLIFNSVLILEMIIINLTIYTIEYNKIPYKRAFTFMIFLGNFQHFLRQEVIEIFNGPEQTLLKLRHRSSC